MFGFSVYLNQDLSREDKQIIHQLASLGFEGIFTSLHIPEDDHDHYDKRLSDLLRIAKKEQLKVMVDISGSTLRTFNLPVENPQAIVDMGIGGLRMDNGISMEQAAALSHYLTVALNASTLLENDYRSLQNFHADFNRIEAWHNYYPRPETGLDAQWFRQKNHWLKQKGMKIVAFASGDSRLRGPLHQGLPTLEDHRHINPLSASLSLLENYCVDRVYIGDPYLSCCVRDQFREWIQNRTLLFRAYSFDKKWDACIFRNDRNRSDPARDVVRSSESRPLYHAMKIPPEHTIPRVRGAITIDNDLYGRYRGEIQLMKRDLPAESRINVIGQIAETDLPLIPFIHAGTKFRIKRIYR
ncbi:MAG: MupG family TIM beta-alpha barrel fold protein [Sporolactobacillus sp.]|nr:MupG family TIM beta-alpha barrel fold protein [Sporolactobacillus sp.]